MSIPAILIQKYDSYERLVQFVAGSAKATLQNYCDKPGHAFTSRIKTRESLAEKIETGRLKKWSDINDLFACTIIIPNLSYEEESYHFCRSAFHFIDEKRSGKTEKAPDVFRFDSTRIYVQLNKPEGLEVVEQPNIYGVTFEIQIKTAFEHAWSVATHDIVYKGPDIDWKRERLAAQIKATVEQLDTLILAFSSTIEHVHESPWVEMAKKQHISQQIKIFEKKGCIPEECLPKDLSRFCNNLFSLLQSNKATKDVAIALNALETEITHVSNAMFPRSISLLQYFLGILVEKKIIDISSGSSKYYWHISEELLQFYPALHKANFKFDYEM